MFYLRRINIMKKKAQNFLGFVFVVVGAVLAASGCDDGTDLTDVVQEGGVGPYTGEDGTYIVKRTVPTLKILKATDAYVWVGYEVPQNEDYYTKITLSSTSGSPSGFSTNPANKTVEPEDDGGAVVTYYAGKVNFPGGVASLTFDSEYVRTITDGVISDSTSAVKKTVSLSVKKSDFLAKASAIPNVTAADVTVYSGKSGVSGTTYDPALVNGANKYRIEVKLPDNLTQVQYLRVQANYTATFPNADYSVISTSDADDKASANAAARNGFSETGGSSISVNTSTPDGYVGTVTSTTTKGFDTYAAFIYTVSERQTYTDGNSVVHYDASPVAIDLKFATASSGADKTTTSAAAYTVNLSGYSTNAGFSIVR
jgi:hypothetical protein